MLNRAGSFRVNLSGESQYKSFCPNPLPPMPALIIDKEMSRLLINANKNLASLETIATKIPNMGLFIAMYVRKEALMSSQIEGTQATLEDILDPQIESNSNRDIFDVISYVKATDYALTRLETLPLCNRLIKETHSILMENSRGEEKTPGEFRRSQNWIGGQGSTIKTARYVPPCVADMKKAMSDLEKYMNEDDGLDPLIQAALIHYQFETIHPFLDGNGRIGRLLITLFLIEKKVLSTPALYISYFLKKNKIEYYDRMTAVRNNGDFEQWTKFFLSAIYESSSDAINAICELIELHNRNVSTIETLGRIGKNAKVVFDYLESKPIIDIRKSSEDLQLSFNTISSVVNKLIEVGILVQKQTTKRNRLFIYEDYLSILRRGT